MTTLLFVLIALNVATLAVGWRLYRRAARAVDPGGIPEAEQRARWMREMETKERWATLDLEGLHPVNREEVEGLLRRIEGASTRVLTATERALLDRMVESQRRAGRA